LPVRRARRPTADAVPPDDRRSRRPCLVRNTRCPGGNREEQQCLVTGIQDSRLLGRSRSPGGRLGMFRRKRYDARDRGQCQRHGQHRLGPRASWATA
jgi:hypothetical protein